MKTFLLFFLCPVIFCDGWRSNWKFQEEDTYTVTYAIEMFRARKFAFFPGYNFLGQSVCLRSRELAKYLVHTFPKLYDCTVLNCSVGCSESCHSETLHKCQDFLGNLTKYSNRFHFQSCKILLFDNQNQEDISQNGSINCLGRKCVIFKSFFFFAILHEI